MKLQPEKLIVVIGLLVAGITIYSSEAMAAQWGEGWGGDSPSNFMSASGGGSYSTPAESGFESIFTISDISYNGNTVDGVSFGVFQNTRVTVGDNAVNPGILTSGSGDSVSHRFPVFSYAQVTLSDNWVDPDTSAVVSAGSVFYINTADISADKIKTTLGSSDTRAARVELSDGTGVWGYMTGYSDGLAGIGNHEKTLLTEQEMDSVFRLSSCPRAYTETNAGLNAKISGGYESLTDAQKTEWQAIYSSATANGLKPWWENSGEAAASYNNLLQNYSSNTSAAVKSSLNGDMKRSGNTASLRAIEFIAGVLSDDQTCGQTYVFNPSGVFTAYQSETKLSIRGVEYTYMLPNLWTE